MLIVKIKDVCKFIFALFLSHVLALFSSYQHIWIITERKAECKDNGYYLFKYLREKHPEIQAFYAIEKNSAQKERALKYGNVIHFNSLKHYVYALLAEYLVGAFIPCGIPDSICFYKFPQVVKGKKIFLQHGIIKEMLPFLKFESTSLDCFICGAYPEWEFVSEHFGYPPNTVKYTGLCRYDGLVNCKKEKMILLMPTWRQWIPSATWHTSYAKDLDNIRYFAAYKELMNSPKLRALLNENGYRLVFFLHHETQPYTEWFGKSDDTVIIASEKEFDVQALLKSASCLITDYSSVAFDFAYLRKPIIYFQFDEQEYYAKHYQRGYFDYDTMGFGPKCTDINSVLTCLQQYFERDLLMDEEYVNRVNTFFMYRDADNCERVYNAIKNI